MKLAGLPFWWLSPQASSRTWPRGRPSSSNTKEQEKEREDLRSTEAFFLILQREKGGKVRGEAMGRVWSSCETI